MSEEIKDPTQSEVEAFRMAQICLTADEWNGLPGDAILADGEIGIDKTSGILKVGNNTDCFNNIPAKFTFYPNS